MQRCEQQSTYQNQVVAYNVVYEYGGQRYSTQTQREPGATIPISVTVNPRDRDDDDYRGPSYGQPYTSSYSYYQPAQPVVVAPRPFAMWCARPVVPVVYSPPVIIRDHDRGGRGRHHGRDDDDRCEERGDGRGMPVAAFAIHISRSGMAWTRARHPGALELIRNRVARARASRQTG